MVLPAVNSFLTFQDGETFSSVIKQANLVSVYYIYILVGYAVSCGALSRWKSWVVDLGFVVCFALLSAYQYYAFSQPTDYLIDYEFPLLPVAAALLFESLRRKAHYLQKLARPIAWLSQRAFGVYFVHVIILWSLHWYVDFSALGHVAHVMVLELASVGGAYWIVGLLGRWSFFRKYVFLIKS
jgi:surface polysaccharide O-acyltransferase-like enzyme